MAAAEASRTLSCHPKGALHGHWVLRALWVREPRVLRDLCQRRELWGLWLDPPEGVRAVVGHGVALHRCCQHGSGSEQISGERTCQARAAAMHRGLREWHVPPDWISDETPLSEDGAEVPSACSWQCFPSCCGARSQAWLPGPRGTGSVASSPQCRALCFS